MSMQNSSPKNRHRKQMYLFLPCLFLLASMFLALRGQSLSNDMERDLLGQQELVHKMNESIHAEELNLGLLNDRRNNLLNNKLNLANAQLERLNRTAYLASSNANQSQYLLFALVLLGLFWTLYYIAWGVKN
jgi:hypothetical protein